MSHSPEGFADLIDEKVRRQFGATVTFCVLPLFVTYEKSSNSRSSSRDVQLLGDLSLGATLGEQFGGAFPTGLAGGPLLGDPRSCLLLAAVGRHAVQIADPEVQHPGVLRAAEGVAVGRERRERRRALLLPPRRLLVGRRRRVDAEVVGIPAGQCGGVAGPEEHASDAGDSFQGALAPRAGRRWGGATALGGQFLGRRGQGSPSGRRPSSDFCRMRLDYPDDHPDDPSGSF
jgi:hypothetical protein